MTDELSGTGKELKALALFQRGTELLRKQEPDRARKLLEKAHEIDPENRDLTLNLSSAFILTRKFKRAVPLLEQLLEHDPENAMIWTNLGAAYLGNPILAKEADQDKAIGAFKTALQFDPIAPSVAYNIALIYRDQKKQEDAEQWFRKALQANPKDRDARMLLDKLLGKDTSRQD